MGLDGRGPTGLDRRARRFLLGGKGLELSGHGRQTAAERLPLLLVEGNLLLTQANGELARVDGLANRLGAAFRLGQTNPGGAQIRVDARQSGTGGR